MMPPGGGSGDSNGDSSSVSIEDKSSSAAANMKGNPGNSNTTLKYVSLITLTGQNAVLGISMRYARTRPGRGK